MIIRPYESRDRSSIENIHKAQGFGYPLPDIEHPIILTKLVLEDDTGTVRLAALLKLTAEAFLLMDGAAETPRERLRMFLALHEAVRQEACAKGLHDVQAFLPPRVARSFGRRLEPLGWRLDPWTCYTRQL
jgi:hypothetical protein